jgi:hypothetical protein
MLCLECKYVLIFTTLLGKHDKHAMFGEICGGDWWRNIMIAKAVAVHTILNYPDFLRDPMVIVRNETHSRVKPQYAHSCARP